ncbi:MAG TPA: preprotein translocase subunit SecE, partial [Pseudoxanthomonas sp.]|nr:preprotein translocase subunit SecE [Pseudoxanthomonas sp.]
RQEAMRTTWVVIVVVIILSLILAAFDFAIKALIELFLNFGR